MTVRVAVVEDAPLLFDLQATLDRLERLTAEAGQGGARLVLFPEAFIDDVTRGKYDLDVVGHYARPDVFQLRVDERAQHTVETLVGEGDQR